MPIFKRGFGDVRDHVEKGHRYTRSCYNCDYFYQSIDDSMELCQNPNVLKYDMVVSDTSIYCSHWVLCSREPESSPNSVKSLFKKGQR